MTACDNPIQLDNVWIVIPAYNEAATIADVVGSLRALGYTRVCVVNDGSVDQTSGLAHNAGAYVLDHITNFGQGAALQTGITYALANGAAYVCTFDADGQHSPQSIGNLLNALQRSGADVALGSRFLRGGERIPPLRRVLLKGALVFTRFHARVRVTDTHNGLRAFTRRAAQSIKNRTGADGARVGDLAEDFGGKLDSWRFLSKSITLRTRAAKGNRVSTQ